jgi:hypothetical protein
MAIKNAQRLDYQGLAAALDQRGLIESSKLQLALNTSAQSGKPFPEILVEDDLIGDWELSRVVCELYNLPFLPIDFCSPNADAVQVFDRETLQNFRLVPLSRFGDLVTVVMPAIVPADVLGSLAAGASVHILPVVGTVVSNNRWISENLTSEDEPAAQAPAPLPARRSAVRVDGLPELPSLGDISINMPEAGGMPDLEVLPAEADDWSNIFDAGDAQVRMNLGDAPPEPPPRPRPPRR